MATHHSTQEDKKRFDEIARPFVKQSKGRISLIAKITGIPIRQLCTVFFTKEKKRYPNLERQELILEAIVFIDEVNKKSETIFGTQPL